MSWRRGERREERRGRQGRSWRTASLVIALLLVVGALAFVSGASPPAGTPPAGQAPNVQAPVVDAGLADRLVADVTADGVLAEIERLQGDAETGGGTRAADTPGYQTALDRLAGMLTEAGFEVSIVDAPALAEVKARSLIAQTRTGRTDEAVMAGAHLDSVRAGPGANDNGSGAAMLATLALRMGSEPPVRNAVRFAWWGAEELGLHGSRAYVKGLSDEQRADIAVYLNFDMIASPNAGYFVYEADSTDGSQQVQDELTRFLADRGVTTAPIDISGRSDHGPFADADIAVGGLFTGADAIKTPEQAAAWGGRAGEPFDRCYHASCDRLDGLDRLALDRCADAAAWLLGTAATRGDLLPDRSARSR